MGMAAVLFNDAESFKQIDTSPSTEGQMWNLVKIGQSFHRRRHLKITRQLLMCIAQEQVHITLQEQNVDCILFQPLVSTFIMGTAAILINRWWLFVQISNPPSTESITWSLKKIGPWVSEEKSFKGVDGQMDGRTDRRLMACDHNSSSRASGSGELKKKTHTHIMVQNRFLLVKTLLYMKSLSSILELWYSV